MSRPIYASPRFHWLIAIAVMFGTLLIEFGVQIVSWMFERAALIFGVTLTLLPGYEAGWTSVGKVLSCLIVTGVVLARSGESWRSLGRVRFAPPALALAWAPLIGGVIIILSEIDNLLRALTPESVLENLDWVPGLGSLLGGSWLGPLLAVVVGPLTEEIIFRGVILRGLLGRYRRWTAIIVSAVLFALMHGNPVQLPVALGLGLVLGWVYVRTRSLGLCFLGHALNNALARALLAAPDAAQVVTFEADREVPQAFHHWASAPATP